MSKRCCNECPKMIYVNTVTFAGGVLTLNFRAGSYRDGERFCFVITENIPDETTINAPVVITIGDGTVEYPLNDRCCAQLTAAALRTRTRYATRVNTTPTGGSFNLIGKACCTPDNSLAAIDGTAPAAGA